MINQLVRYAPLLERLRDDRRSLLEVGSGSDGIASYLGRRCFGLEIRFAATPAPELIACGGSATAIPFKDSSIDIVLVMDTMEHIPPDLRASAVAEACRVARSQVIIGGPMGADSRRADDRLAAYYARTGRAVPEWLKEHLLRRAPDVDEIVDQLRSQGWHAKVEGNENLRAHLRLMRFESTRFGGRITNRLRRHLPGPSAALVRKLSGKGPYYSWLVTAEPSS